MKLLAVILSFCFSSSNLFGCLEAHQTRLLPIAMSPDGLIAVTIELQRTHNRENVDLMDVAWHGNAHLNEYNDENILQSSELLMNFGIVSDSFLPKLLDSIFELGLVRVQKLSTATLLQPIQLTFCDFQQSCSLANLEFDTIENKTLLKVKNQKPNFLNSLQDTNSTAKEYLIYYNNFGDTPSSKAFFSSLYISSIRQFKSGDKTITIVHLCSGQLFRDVEFDPSSAPKEYAPKQPFHLQAKSTFIEPILHHGHGFDLFVIQ